MAIEFNKSSLAYLVTSAAGTLTSFYYSSQINGVLDAQTSYKQIPEQWGTLGTDYSGTIGEIALLQFLVRTFNKNRLNSLVNYVIPVAVAALNTALESLDKIGVDLEELIKIANPNTRGGFSETDIACYCAGAITMALFSVLYTKLFNRTETPVAGKTSMQQPME